MVPHALNYGPLLSHGRGEREVPPLSYSLRHPREGGDPERLALGPRPLDACLRRHNVEAYLASLRKQGSMGWSRMH